MEQLNWGQVTPEFTLDKTNESFHGYVYNHDLSSMEKVERTIRFIVGRLNYYDRHLPPNPFHEIRIDIRGQNIDNSICGYIVNGVKSKYERPASLSIEFITNNNGV